MVEKIAANTHLSHSERTTLPVKIGTHIALTLFLDALLLWMMYHFIFGGAPANQPGQEWIAIAIMVVGFVILNVISIPLMFRHYVSFEERFLEIGLGLHTARIAYTDIISVAANASPLLVFHWYVLMSSGIRIRYGLSDELIAIDDEERFFAELSKRNPVIEIIRD